jgi:hypothetical protein
MEVANVDSSINVGSSINVDGSFNVENSFPALEEVINVDGRVNVEKLYEISTLRTSSLRLRKDRDEAVINVDGGVNIESFINDDRSFDVENLFSTLEVISVDSHVNVENSYELSTLTIPSTLRTSSQPLQTACGLNCACYQGNQGNGFGNITATVH